MTINVKDLIWTLLVVLNEIMQLWITRSLIWIGFCNLVELQHMGKYWIKKYKRQNLNHLLHLKNSNVQIHYLS